jgi:hypothetical protein
MVCILYLHRSVRYDSNANIVSTGLRETPSLADILKSRCPYADSLLRRVASPLDIIESWLVELVYSISLKLTVSQFLAYNLIAELMRSSAVWDS